jgi:hypothetical protein
MSLTNLSLAGNNYIIPGQGDGKIANLFYSVERSIIVYNLVLYSFYILKVCPFNLPTVIASAGYAYFTDILRSDFIKKCFGIESEKCPLIMEGDGL